MKRICERCNVISQDFNLWCQEKYCPAENSTEIFDNGEWFGPIEIIQPIVITRSAIVYQASRGVEKILLKIANTGCEEKLRAEAKTFLQLKKIGQHPLLPVLLPAHPQGTVEAHPYGWIVINGVLKYLRSFRVRGWRYPSKFTTQESTTLVPTCRLDYLECCRCYFLPS